MFSFLIFNFIDVLLSNIILINNSSAFLIPHSIIANDARLAPKYFYAAELQQYLLLAM